MKSAAAIREMRATDLPAVRCHREGVVLPPLERGDDRRRAGAGSCAQHGGRGGGRRAGSGRLSLGRRYPDVWHVMDLAVAPAFRRQGIARALVAEFLAAAGSAGRGVLLEVREGNAEAVALYEGLGFVTAGVRRRYYPDTGEDALVMLREPAGEDGAPERRERRGPAPSYRVLV